MIKPIFFAIVSLGLANHATAADCAMRPALIDVARIARDPAVKSYVVDKNKLVLSALLKNGRVLKLRHMGCEHSGATAALWLDSTLALSDAKAWTREIADFARVAFAPAEASDISASLRSGKTETTTTDDRIVIEGAPNTFMRYKVTIDSLEEGVLMTITYSLG